MTWAHTHTSNLDFVQAEAMQFETEKTFQQIKKILR